MICEEKNKFGDGEIGTLAEGNCLILGLKVWQDLRTGAPMKSQL